MKLSEVKWSEAKWRETSLIYLSIKSIEESCSDQIDVHRHRYLKVGEVEKKMNHVVG